MNNNLKCPKCGKSYYSQGMSTSTCVYYPPIYRDGENINPDRNMCTTQYHCLECGCNWSVSSNDSGVNSIVKIIE